MRHTTRLQVLAALAILPAAALAQGTPGTNLTVDVRVVEATMRGDTVRIGYVVRNAETSLESLWEFTVAAPSPVLRLGVPGPAGAWTGDTRYVARSVASWAILDSPYIPPGAETPVLWFEAIGVPTIVTSWAGGYFALPAHQPDTMTSPDPDAPAPQPVDVLDGHSVAGVTLGVESPPANATPGNLLARTGGFLTRACGELGWITQEGVCNSLRTKLDNAMASLGRGQASAATGQLRSLLGELDAQRSRHVADAAYWLLRLSTEAILARL